MMATFRIVILGLIVVLPLAILAAVGLVYLIRHIAQGSKKDSKQPKKREIDKMKIEDL